MKSYSLFDEFRLLDILLGILSIILIITVLFVYYYPCIRKHCIIYFWDDVFPFDPSVGLDLALHLWRYFELGKVSFNPFLLITSVYSFLFGHTFGQFLLFVTMVVGAYLAIVYMVRFILRLTSTYVRSTFYIILSYLLAIFYVFNSYAFTYPFFSTSRVQIFALFGIPLVAVGALKLMKNELVGYLLFAIGTFLILISGYKLWCQYILLICIIVIAVRYLLNVGTKTLIKKCVVSFLLTFSLCLPLFIAPIFTIFSEHSTYTTKAYSPEIYTGLFNIQNIQSTILNNFFQIGYNSLRNEGYLAPAFSYWFSKPVFTFSCIIEWVILLLPLLLTRTHELFRRQRLCKLYINLLLLLVLLHGFVSIVSFKALCNVFLSISTKIPFLWILHNLWPCIGIVYFFIFTVCMILSLALCYTHHQRNRKMTLLLVISVIYVIVVNIYPFMARLNILENTTVPSPVTMPSYKYNVTMLLSFPSYYEDLLRIVASFKPYYQLLMVPTVTTHYSTPYYIGVEPLKYTVEIPIISDHFNSRLPNALKGVMLLHGPQSFRHGAGYSFWILNLTKYRSITVSSKDFYSIETTPYEIKSFKMYVMSNSITKTSYLNVHITLSSKCNCTVELTLWKVQHKPYTLTAEKVKHLLTKRRVFTDKNIKLQINMPRSSLADKYNILVIETKLIGKSFPKFNMTISIDNSSHTYHLEEIICDLLKMNAIKYIVVRKDFLTVPFLHGNIDLNYLIDLYERRIPKLCTNARVTDVRREFTVLVINDANTLMHTKNAKLNEIKRISLTKWLVKIEANKPFLLYFYQKYDPNWKISIIKYNETKIVPENLHFIAYAYANVWFINETGNFIVELYYEPQRYYSISLLVSLSTFILLTIYLVYSYVQDKLKLKNIFSLNFSHLNRPNNDT